MSATKQLWLLVGGNGAGKTTFYRTRLEPSGIPFVNADVVAKELWPDAPEQNSYRAAKLVEEMRLQLLREGKTFCFETVFSHPSKVDFVANAKAQGYQIILVFVHLELMDLNKARVSQRVEAGGHHVPDDTLEARIPRTLKYIKSAIPLCDEVYIVDNSSATNPFKMIASLKNGRVLQRSRTLPDWAEAMLP